MFLTVSIICVLFALQVSATPDSTNALGELSGVTLDNNDGVIPDGEVTVIRGHVRHTVKVSARGEFRMALPAGMYVVRFTGANFLPYSRAPIYVAPDHSVFLFLRPVFRAPSDQFSIRDPQVKEEMVFGGASGVMARFNRSDRHEGEIRFIGPDTMLTWRDVAVYAGSIRCTQSKIACEAEDHVLVEMGRKVYRSNAIAINLMNRKLQIGKAHPIIVPLR